MPQRAFPRGGDACCLCAPGVDVARHEHAHGEEDVALAVGEAAALIEDDAREVCTCLFLGLCAWRVCVCVVGGY